MSKQLNTQELFRFFEPFGMMLHSGISAAESLQLLKEDCTDTFSQELLSRLNEEMEVCGRLSEAMEHTGMFPQSATSYIRAGEETGCLDEVMQSLTAHYEQEAAISSQIRSAVTYPLFMLAMMGGVICILLIKVLPVFQQVFRQMGMELTGLSAGLLHLGELISRYAIVFLLVLAVLIGLILYLFFAKQGRVLLRKILRQLPYLKEIPVTMDYAQLTHGMALGIKSGLGPDQSLHMAESLISDPQIKSRLTEALKRMDEGELFNDAMTKSELFGGVDAQMISVGYRSGSLDEVMEKITQRYDEASVARIEHTVGIIEPTIVIILSLLVGLVLLSVMIPLLGILSGVMM
jgi:type IV pilus assembly protein PilC